MAARKPNVQKLEEAGVLHSKHCTDAHLAAINKLSPEEVAALIKVRKKMSAHLGAGAAREADQAGRPWML